MEQDKTLGEEIRQEEQQEQDIPAVTFDEFEIPSDHVVYGMAALGYPADAPKKEIHKIGEIRIIK